MSEEQISQLVGDIYDAALEPAMWPRALEGICGFVGGSMANIFWQNVAAKTAGELYEWGNDPHYTQLYMETYAKANPLFPAAYFFPVGQVFSQCEVMPYEELHGTRLYKEWMQPQGYVDFIACHLEKSSVSVVPTTVIRHERDGLVDEETRRRMGLVVPHVRRAALIGNVVNLRTCDAASLADSLDGLAAGMFLVEATGLIAHVNVAGQGMLDKAKVLHSAGSRLAANDLDADRLLQHIFAAAAAGDAAVGKDGVAVPMQSSDGERYVAHVLPLTAGARRHAGAAYAAVAAVFVHEAALATPSAPETIAKAYGLTAMEVRVLLGIVETGGVPAVSADLGISGTTVRTHLKNLFAKTGTNRQADLVKLVAAFASPLAGGSGPPATGRST
jgi:DNA-binding CsgD family transcriptional regulator